jgi:AraC-like DNA-binding protein
MLQSRNYVPSKDLLPFIRRHYVFEADMADDFAISDNLLSETAFVRTMLRGQWVGEIAPGVMGSAASDLLFGGNSRPFPVAVKGPFTVVGFGVRPSAWQALFREQARDLCDRMLPLSECWGDIACRMMEELYAARDDATRIAALEKAIRAQLSVIGRWGTDQQVGQFESVTRINSAAHIEDIARQLCLSLGQLERRVTATYGLTPKTVLRRSRFLELASAMRGLANPEDAQLATLRYFDQSHMNREFKRFVGLTPAAFRKAQTPLFDVGLKLRVEGLSLD